MKIAIFSDIHDHIWNLKKALAGVQDAEVLICCGDMCSPFVVDLLVEGFNGRPIHAVAGNNDGDPRRITEKSKRFPNFQYHGEFFQTELGGRLLAVNHYDSLALPIAASGQYDVVCYGHNHRFAIQPGPSLAINPGTIMGFDAIAKVEIPATFAIYDSDNHSAQGYCLPADGDPHLFVPFPE